MTVQKLAISVCISESADIPIRIESDTIRYVAISGMAKTAPLRVTAPAHGIKDGWRACIQNAAGMSALNTEWEGLRDADLRPVRLIDANNVDFPGVNATGFRTYTDGGQIALWAPKDLSAYTSGSMRVFGHASDVLLTLSTTDGTLEIDNPNAAFWLHLTPTTFVGVDAGEYKIDITLTDGTDALSLCCADSVLTLRP